MFHSMRVHQCASIKFWSFNLFHSYVLSPNLFHSLVSWLLGPSVLMELPMNANCVVQHRHAIESTRISSKCVVQHMGGGKHNPEVRSSNGSTSRDSTVTFLSSPTLHQQFVLLRVHVCISAHRIYVSSSVVCLVHKVYSLAFRCFEQSLGGCERGHGTLILRCEEDCLIVCAHV